VTPSSDGTRQALVLAFVISIGAAAIGPPKSSGPTVIVTSRGWHWAKPAMSALADSVLAPSDDELVDSDELVDGRDADESGTPRGCPSSVHAIEPMSTVASITNPSLTVTYRTPLARYCRIGANGAVARTARSRRFATHRRGSRGCR
jgi:hypothetical protein